MFSVFQVKATSSLPFSGFGGDYCLFYDNGDVNRWTWWDAYWLERAADLKEYGMDTVSLIFGFKNTSSEYGSYYTPAKFEQALDLFDSYDITVLAYLLDDYSTYPDGWIGTSDYWDNWINFIGNFTGDSRIAAVSLYSEMRDEEAPSGWNAHECFELFANLTKAIHAVDSTRWVIFPYWGMYSGYTEAQWIADIQSENLDEEDYTLFDALHPYYFDDNSAPDPYDMELTPTQKAYWYANNQLQPAVAVFGGDKVFCGETFAVAEGGEIRIGYPCSEANQEAFFTAMINWFVYYGTGFAAISSLGAVATYNANLIPLLNSDYVDMGPVPTPTPGATPTPTVPPSPTPTGAVPTVSPTIAPAAYFSPFYSGIRDVAVGSNFQIVLNSSEALDFQSQLENFTFHVDVLAGTLNATECTLGMNNRGGSLYFHNNNLTEIQISHNNEFAIKLIYDGLSLSDLVAGHSWNGTIPADVDAYIQWGFIFLLPHEENFMLYIGLFGIALFSSGSLLGAYSFKKYPIFSFERETIWETGLLMYSFIAAFIGIGLVITWLLS